MPQYVAFLRAINLGATRKFAKAGLVAATESIGATGVATHINTGNVFLTSSLRSRARVEAALERAYAGAAGFDVPTVVLTPAELVEVVAFADALVAEHGEPAQHTVTLYKKPPPAAAVHALARAAHEDTAFVDGRTVHALLGKDIHTSRLLASKEFAALGVGTARNARVLRAIVAKWC